MMDIIILIAIIMYGLLDGSQFNKIGRKLDELDELIRDIMKEKGE